MARGEGWLNESLSLVYISPHKLVSFSRTKIVVQGYN
jgi:hypothetical protein